MVVESCKLASRLVAHESGPSFRAIIEPHSHGKKLDFYTILSLRYHHNAIPSRLTISQEYCGGRAGKMADPRQMWENLQKGLARAQQSGQRSVNINHKSWRLSKLNRR
jgi:hypothetical protein